MIFALIKDDLVCQLIVADQSFADALEENTKWDLAVDVTDMDPRPRIGDAFDGSSFDLVDNDTLVENIDNIVNNILPDVLGG